MEKKSLRSIDHQELKQKMDDHVPFRLVMALNEWQYRMKRIPGSLYFATIQMALDELNKEDEIIVYCSDQTCIASAALGRMLEHLGYAHVLHFPGGLAEWEQAGYPLEGLDVSA